MSVSIRRMRSPQPARVAASHDGCGVGVGSGRVRSGERITPDPLPTRKPARATAARDAAATLRRTQIRSLGLGRGAALGFLG